MLLAGNWSSRVFYGMELEVYDYQILKSYPLFKKKKNMEVLEMVESDFSMRILCKP